MAGALGVVITTDVPMSGQHAQPVYVDDTLPIVGPSRAIVVTNGEIPPMGGPAIPVRLAPAGTPALGPALPVYVVPGGGSLGSNPLAYTNKVKALNPIAYWPLAEASGSVAFDESGNARNGAYTAVTLGQPGIGDGRTSALFVPASNSKNNVYSASLAGAINTAEGTIACWFLVSGAGVWTDATQRQVMIFLSDASNSIRMHKSSSNNRFTWNYAAGGTSKSLDGTIGPLLGWTHVAMTWSKSADEAKFYLNGAQVGSTLTSLGTFAGPISSIFATVGAGDNTATPGAKWDGSLAHAAIWNTPLSAAQIASLAVVP